MVRVYGGRVFRAFGTRWWIVARHIVARHEHLRQIGAGLADLLREEGVTMGVLEATCRYHAPAWFDDLLTVSTSVAEMRTRTATFLDEIRRDGTPIATGRTVQIFLKNGTAVAIPERVRSALLR